MHGGWGSLLARSAVNLCLIVVAGEFPGTQALVASSREEDHDGFGNVKFKVEPSASAQPGSGADFENLQPTANGEEKRAIGNVLIVVIVAVSVSTLICILALAYKRFCQRSPSYRRSGRVSTLPSPSLSRHEVFIQEISALDTPPAYDDLFSQDTKFCFDPPTYLECMEKTQYGFCNCATTPRLPRSLKFSEEDTVCSTQDLYGKYNSSPRSSRYASNTPSLEIIGLRGKRSPKSPQYNNQLTVQSLHEVNFKGNRLRVTFDHQATVHSLENFQNSGSPRPRRYNNQLTVQSLHEINVSRKISRPKSPVIFDHQATVHSMEGIEHFGKSRSPSPRRSNRFVTTPSQLDCASAREVHSPDLISTEHFTELGDDGVDNQGFVDIHL